MTEFDMKSCALRYAILGLSVFPLRPRNKTPLTTNGHKDASTDPKQIEAWWNKYPSANIGIATGKPSGGLVVIDLDVDKEKGIDGRETLREWERHHGKLPDNTWISITGRGGYHYFYKDQAGSRSKAGLYEGIDIRGDGGYIVAPPSIHPNGHRYEWEQAPGEIPLAAADDKVNEFLYPAPKKWEQDSFSLPDQIPEGGRVNAMVKLVCSQQGKGLSDEAIRAAVRAENEAKCFPPLTDEELEKEVFPALGRYQKGTSPYYGGKDYSKRSNWKEQPPARQPKKIEYMNAVELIHADIPPVEYIVKGMLTKGLGGLSAKSKLGKSWLSLQLGVAVASGSDFLGFTTIKSGVLYIDLENMPALSQERLRLALNGMDPPENLHFVYDFNIIGQGFEEDLQDFLDKYPDVKLVIVDVFQKVKCPKKINQTDYEADYEILTEVRKLAIKYDICILPVYHDRKFMDPTDPFTNLLGSTALMGVSDFMWVLFKENRDDPEATLAMTGRTIKESKYKLKKNGALWENMGGAAVVEETRKRREYDNDPLVNTIRKLVSQNHGEWRGRVSEIISSSQYFKGCRIYDSPQKTGKKLIKLLKDLEKYDSIYHTDIDKGTASCIHVFKQENPFAHDSPLS